MLRRPDLGVEALSTAAKYQILLHIQYLMDPISGFWYHAWLFDKSGTKGRYSSDALWARGNCWASLPVHVSTDHSVPVADL